VRVLASLLGTVLLVLAALHLYWAIRGVSGGSAVPSRADGVPILRPGRLASLVVAGALAMAAGLVLARAQLIGAFAPSAWIRNGTWGVALAFGARTIGEFRYVGLFRRVQGTSFARWDARLFTPLCAALAVGTAWLAAS
jgi:Protein of unknown function (DUF3995)